MRMLRAFNALSYQNSTNETYLHNVSISTKARNYRILYVMVIFTQFIINQLNIIKMSLDIRIKENNKTVYDKNFYGFVNFSDTKRFDKASQILKENPVFDKKSFITFIEKSVEIDRQSNYINLIKSDKSKVTVDIY